MTYLFKTSLTMKDYNDKKYWIDGDYIRDLKITSDDVKSAIRKYRDIIADGYGVTISDNAIRNKGEMFIDTENGSEPAGFVFTGKTSFDKGDYTGWTEQFINVWTTIYEIKLADLASA